MVAAHPAIVPLVNNSATLTTMGFAFPGFFSKKKYNYDAAIFPATVQQTAVIFTTGLIVLVDLRTPISVNKIAVTAMLALLIYRNPQQYIKVILSSPLAVLFLTRY